MQDPMESIAQGMGMSAMQDESRMGGGLSGLGANSAMHGTVNMVPPASLTPPGMVPGIFQPASGPGAATHASQGTRAVAAEDSTSLPQQSMVAGAVAQQVWPSGTLWHRDVCARSLPGRLMPI